MGDDGAGPHIISLLQDRYAFPENVALQDLGTPGLALCSFVTGYSHLIFVDTVHDAGAPGTIRRYDKTHLLTHPLQKRVSPHDPAFNEALLIADMAGGGCSEAVLIGIIPERVEQSTELTPAIRNALTSAIEAVLGELRQIGIEVHERPATAKPLSQEDRELIFNHF
jgi:hydrogenase maturation protease